MPTLAQLNVMDRVAFTAALGHLFEHSPWVASDTWSHRPFTSVDRLFEELCATLHRGSYEQQLELMKAHPDLAGRLAQQNQLTEDSAREQASAGLTQLTPEEWGEFRELNEAYRRRFGFPFIVCARLTQKSAILVAMRQRMNNTPGTEFDTALAEIEKIARLRLDSVLQAD
jgi:2-oxo-4-hydroxy-4-carboxy-5-ureidoimidazoline decarboxylase